MQYSVCYSIHSILELFSNFLGGILTVSLRGDAKEAQSVLEGRYFLQASNNEDNYWIQENGANAIWYNEGYGNTGCEVFKWGIQNWNYF